MTNFSRDRLKRSMRREYEGIYNIDKILQVADTANLELQVSNTKLKRMNKDALNKLLAELMEAASRESMARAVGAKGTDDKSIGIASLRMVHDMIAMATENGLNTVLPG